MLELKNHKSKKITHIINSLGDGGAERNLFNLVSADRKNNLHTIIVLSKKNKYSKLFKKKIRVFILILIIF